ncbi:Hypothetical protein CINCED_3A020432 [Cinara cedri]|uniref:PiggyBac transposable element-derived protein domain-containing protein n=1 Tax=Cinara cedri TaxID=506608 RepID=A0A5E4N5C6_9HEMI|nr:Hypothetical protein CINCED_3A020432 [Cinara cedri]
MSRRLRSANILLERINDIDAECSGDDQEILDMENDNTENYDPLETDSNTDENISNEVKIGSNPGRALRHNIFREASGSSGYSKRINGEVRTAFSVIIDNDVDVTDQMARNYSVKSKSRRWPLQVFFNILDLAGINAWVLYKETTGGKLQDKNFYSNWQKNLPSNTNKSAAKKINQYPSKIQVQVPVDGKHVR